MALLILKINVAVLKWWWLVKIFCCDFPLALYFLQMVIIELSK